ncbi:protein PXR1-like [Benincasa hispida]|uniref:protein PXR1-like n=1 Tax=Benincasa hispida TaxID=102211 RepID=UPI00190085F6|nr:protein PXR1-like [Benincasa hispida]
MEKVAGGALPEEAEKKDMKKVAEAEKEEKKREKQPEEAEKKDKKKKKSKGKKAGEEESSRHRKARKNKEHKNDDEDEEVKKERKKKEKEERKLRRHEKRHLREEEKVVRDFYRGRLHENRDAVTFKGETVHFSAKDINELYQMKDNLDAPGNKIVEDPTEELMADALRVLTQPSTRWSVSPKGIHTLEYKYLLPEGRL